MKAKICFNNEIHRISNLPDSLSAFRDVVTSIFKSTLPLTWTLQYIDCEGDKIVIGNDHDYSELKHWGSQGSSIVKIFVESSQFGTLSEIKREESESAQSVSRQEEDYLVIEEPVPQVEVSKSLEESVELKPAVVEEKVQEEPKKEVVPEKEILQEEEKPVLKAEVPEQKALEFMGEGKVLVDLEVLQKMMENMIQKSLPTVVEVTKESLLKEKANEDARKGFVRKVVHYGISCNGCGSMPIVGVRYKCSVCPNFDFCENCEATRPHIHNFVKMRERDLLDMFRPNSAYHNNNNHYNKPKEHEKKHHNNKYQPYEWPHNNKKPIGDSNNERFRAVKGKAEKLKKTYPRADFEILLAYVSGCPDDFSIEELIENYKH